MNQLVQQNGNNVVSAILQNNDLSKLTGQQKNDYYMGVCSSLGLNPMTRPFEFIRLSGKETLYAKRDCADQLRKINSISIEVVSREIADDILTVHVRAKDGAGRRDEDFGAVCITGLKGENLANAMLKAVTKAKRRVTLSISGLGFLDETEVADVPGAKHVEELPDTTDIKQQAKEFAEALEIAPTAEMFESLVKENIKLTSQLATELPAWHSRLINKIDQKREMLEKQAYEEIPQ